MVDDERNVVITATIGGRRLRLATPKQWRAAIANNDITRNMQVDYESEPGSKSTRAAGDIPELDAFFEELHGPREVALPPLPPPPPPRPQRSMAPAKTPVADQVDDPDKRVEFEYSASSGYSDSKSKIIGAGFITVLLAALVIWSFDNEISPETEPEPTHSVTAANLNCREEPTTRSAVVMQYAQDDQIVSSEELNGWIKSQNECWVNGNYVNEIAAEQVSAGATLAAAEDAAASSNVDFNVPAYRAEPQIGWSGSSDESGGVARYGYLLKWGDPGYNFEMVEDEWMEVRCDGLDGTISISFGANVDPSDDGKRNVIFEISTDRFERTGPIGEAGLFPATPEPLLPKGDPLLDAMMNGYRMQVHFGTRRPEPQMDVSLIGARKVFSRHLSKCIDSL